MYLAHHFSLISLVSLVVIHSPVIPHNAALQLPKDNTNNNPPNHHTTPAQGPYTISPSPWAMARPSLALASRGPAQRKL